MSESVSPSLDVQVLPLVRNPVLPIPAPARTRDRVPPGYGVREQCLPFTAATALGLLVGSPISFGLCPPTEVPAGCHPFRSPLACAESRVFYVRDDPDRGFARNAFALDRGGIQPGISFFDREDQGDLFKLHLPYAWRTPPGVHALFLPPLNRPAPSFEVLAGLVETDWYAHPVNLAIRKPTSEVSLHVAAGDPVVQVILIGAGQRRPELKVLADHNRAARELLKDLDDWRQRHAADRSAYKRLARSRHGRIGEES